MDETFDRLAKVLSPRYRFKETIDTGGGATVYLAEDTLYQRRVAVKLLRSELAASVTVDRFNAEIRVAAHLEHPNIVPVYTSGAIDGLPYYVMPFIEGGSLRVRLRRVKRLSIGDALRITEDIARALDFAHRHQVVHRDIKPENVMMHGRRAMLVDFGIALSLVDTEAPRRTSPGMRVGTAEYMSPEQATGEPAIDGRSDIYSLACVTYEMLCGRPPFTGSAMAVMNGHATAEPRALAAHCPDVPRAISDVLARALVKTPGERFATAGEFAAAIRRASADHRPECPRVAVLSFVHTRGTTSPDTFNDRITEQVVYALTDLGGLEVATRSTIMRADGKLHVSKIAQELEADALLFGHVREAGATVHVTGTLLSATNGSHLWSGSFSGRQSDRVSLFSELAAQLARAVGQLLVGVHAASPDSEETRMTVRA